MIRLLLLWLLRLYRALISPWLGNVCRFEPSCSRYASACIEHHGALKGSWLTVKRLCKCHPFHPGGYDPPPLSQSQLQAQAGKAHSTQDHVRSSLPATQAGGV